MIQGNDIKRVKEDWAIGLMQKGLIVDVAINRWRGTTKLTPDDLGISFVDDEAFQFCRKYISLGRQKLLPPEISATFDALETAARVALKAMSFDTVWGRFVPETALLEWEEVNKGIHDQYMEAACAFGNRYNEIVEWVRNDYKAFARDVWARLYPEDKNGATSAYIESFAQRAVEKIPPREEIVSSFSYRHIFLEIPLPSFIQKEVKYANDIKREDELAQESVEIEKDAKRRIARIYIDKKEEFVNEFLQSTVGCIRAQVAELCQKVLASLGRRMAKNGDLTLPQRRGIRSMISKVEKLNFYNDKEIADLLKDLEKETSKIKGEMDNDVIKARLEKIVAVASGFSPEDFNPTIGYLGV